MRSGDWLAGARPALAPPGPKSHVNYDAYAVDNFVVFIPDRCGSESAARGEFGGGADDRN
jgi:hypothetical protein